MQIEKFREFLLREYRGFRAQPLRPKSANDAISRCKRLERTFGIDLDAILQGEDLTADRLNSLLDARTVALDLEVKGENDMRGAARLYLAFLQNQQRS